MSGFNLFVYAPPSPGGLPPLPAQCERVGSGVLHGTLYLLDQAGPVLMLYGDTEVSGEIWRCPAETLPELDRNAGTDAGRLRRLARSVARPGGGEAVPCWVYVAGPLLARQLIPERRTSPR